MTNRIKCITCDAESFTSYGKTGLHCSTCYTKLLSENEELRAALEFYANPQTWTEISGGSAEIFMDEGDFARKTLQSQNP